MEELKKEIIEKIKKTNDVSLLQEIQHLLEQKEEIEKLEDFVVESRIEELEDDEFLSHDEAVKRAESSLETKNRPRS